MPPQADLSFPFDARWIAEVLQRSGSLSASSPDLNAWTHHRFSEFTTDSRKIAAHSIFVAVRGERFDGHAFIEQAIAAGATGILAKAQTIAERGYERQFPKVFFAGVTDVQAAFRRLAQAWRAQTKIPVIAVAGSNGKTTTKELLAAILEGRFHSVLKTTGSENGYLGIPITLLRLRSSHQAAVIEVGIDDVGAMTEHIDLVRPTHTVLTVIGPEHLEKLGTLETVAREELLAFSETEKNGGCSVVNLDDTWMATASEHLTQPWKFSLREITDTFSGAETCEARRVQGIWTASGTSEVAQKAPSSRLRILSPLHDPSGRLIQNHDFTLAVPLPGKHNAQNLLAATSVALALGLSSEEISKGLEGFRGAEGRSQVRALDHPQGALVICDYYNASPVSMQAAFSLLARTGGADRERVACLADMKELGSEELRFHADLATPLMQSGVRTILLYGPRMTALEEALKAKGFSGKVAHFETLSGLTSALRPLLHSQSIVLIKGSRSMKMEAVWEALSPAQAPSGAGTR